MAQRCSYCGKTRKQHAGRACVDREGFKKVLKEQTANGDSATRSVAQSGLSPTTPEGKEQE